MLIYLLNMFNLKPSLRCPYCQAQAQITEIHCESCACRVQAVIKPNEFSFLDEEDLHFLRMFLQFEGRIKEMEAPLGLSYPTVRSRLVQLKEKILGFQTPAEASKGEQEEASTQSLIEDLKQGKRSYEETLHRIKNKKRRRE